ncbi:MAG: DNA translocase FtsK 4TM domain-containing protein [Burkholderiaceae bacterium]|nr:DNA translocase FtsK 4TM domain-containing protein [Burkholderiaceae bacterium]
MKKPALTKEKADILKPSRKKSSRVKAAETTATGFSMTATPEHRGVLARLTHSAPYLGFIMLMVTVLYAAMLISYSSTDPSFTYATVNKPVANWIGPLGAWGADIAFFVFGWSAYWLIGIGLMVVIRLFGWAGNQGFGTRIKHALGLLFLLLGSCTLEAIRLHSLATMLPGDAGGVVGQICAVTTVPYLGAIGMTIVAVFSLLLGAQLSFDFSWLRVAEWVGALVDSPRRRFSQLMEKNKDLKAGEAEREKRGELHRTEPALPVEEPFVAETPSTETSTSPLTITTQATVKPSLDSLEQRQTDLFDDGKDLDIRPQLKLLDEVGEIKPSIDNTSLQIMSGMIESKLRTFGVNVKVMQANPGPVVTRYQIELEDGMKASQVKNLESDLARVLGVQSVRILDTVPGTSYMGIEAPNPKRQIVKIAELLGSQDFAKSKATLPICLGKRITGEPYVVDLAKMPHLMVAGTTGSGKSVGVNSMILSLLYKFTPQKLRFIMIDPKSVEFSYYEDIPHLLCPVVTDMREAYQGLQWCVKEMERRYKLAQMLKTRSIEGYNARVRELRAQGKVTIQEAVPNAKFDAPLEELPYIVVIVDELADLLMVEKKGVESSLIRLAQKARAASIHLILATQRPSADVITGLLRTNIPSRAAFQVATASDSRIILDMGGAESLLGYGDFLFKTPGMQALERVQGAFVTDDELDRVTSALRSMAQPQYVEDVLAMPEDEEGDGGTGEDGERAGGSSSKLDPLFDRAVQEVIESGKCSVTYLQRRLGVGYPRAANLVDQMEREGIVTPPDSSNRRTILARRGGDE